jgi:hypothetical protein
MRSNLALVSEYEEYPVSLFPVIAEMLGLGITKSGSSDARASQYACRLVSPTP